MDKLYIFIEDEFKCAQIINDSVTLHEEIDQFCEDCRFETYYGGDIHITFPSDVHLILFDSLEFGVSQEEFLNSDYDKRKVIVDYMWSKNIYNPRKDSI
jgi:hypothetical protein